MREDMAKVIVERPRVGGSSRVRAEWSRISSFGVLRARDRADESPTRESIRGRWANRKDFSDHLGPLVRFVRSNVGRPWNKVHSEIAARLDRGNTVQRHVLLHLERDIVHRSVVEQPDGSITDVRGAPLRRWSSNEVFFVCPRTGLLRRQLLGSRKRKRQPPSIDVATPYHKVNGAWFEVRFAPIPDLAHPWDVLVKEHGRRGWSRGLHWRDGGDQFAVAKRQLSKKEIRRAGLDA